MPPKAGSKQPASPPKEERKREREWGDNKKASPLAGPTATPDMATWKDIFPAPTGDIDFWKYEMPQTRSALEWWYHNAHLTSKKDGTKFSIFSSFFAQADLTTLTDEEYAAGGNYEYFYACTWALSEIDAKKYHPDCLLDHRTTDRMITKLDPKYSGQKMKGAEPALLEMVKKGRVPRPDRLMQRPAKIVTGKDRLELNFDDDCVLIARKPKAGEVIPAGAPDVVYELTCHNPFKNIRANLTFIPQRPVTRHGQWGVVNEMFYYYVPRMAVQGTIDVNGEVHQVEGSGWYDREFGGSRDVTGGDALDAWTWFSCQLSDNSELSVFYIVDQNKMFEKEKLAILTTADGERHVTYDLSLSYSNMWTSLATYCEYPQQWKISCPSLGIDLYASNAYPHQEFVTIIVGTGGFYEGRININGSSKGKSVTGTGFVERKNHLTYRDTAGLLTNVGRYVKKTLSNMYPLTASQEWVNEKVLGRHATKEGSDATRVCDAVFKPVRALIDRGGKSWRSLILVSSVNALSADYFDCSKYIAISELLHVGSLIIDDIQDESAVRRGGKTVHLEYGIATAINAGTMCYFMAPLLMEMKTLTKEQQLEIYDLYFDVLRAGHAGQGLDIAGLDSFMPEVVETGDTSKVLAALRAIHIYKTGGAAGTLCRMACVICKATEGQAWALENFGTQIGLAFQIVDDALNLRGFEGDLKEIGEDIKDGKVTYPVIKAMSRLDRSDREYIWTILQEHTHDQGKIHSVIAKLNSVAAIDDCLVEARNLCEDAWVHVDRELPDTLSKIMMRTFCMYLTERTF